MRGAFTAAPSIVDPVMKMPHAAPMTQSVSASADPTFANANGSMWLRTSAQFVLYKPGVTVGVGDLVAISGTSDAWKGAAPSAPVCQSQRTRAAASGI